MYDSWEIKCDRHNFLSLWTVFYPVFWPRESKFQKNEKELEDIIILQMCTVNETIWCMIPEIIA